MSEPERVEQIISQFLRKVLCAVIGARVPGLCGGATGSRRGEWFNLAVGSLPAALDRPDFRRRCVTIFTDPMIIDISLCSLKPHGAPDVLLERWCVGGEHLEHRSPSRELAGESLTASSVYKRLALLLRSLYISLRLLPAYGVFRTILSSHNSNAYDIIYKVSIFTEPFTLAGDRNLELYSFPKAVTQLGDVSLSVIYRAELPDLVLEVASFLPPVIIDDYVDRLSTEPMTAAPSATHSCPMQSQVGEFRQSSHPLFGGAEPCGTSDSLNSNGAFIPALRRCPTFDSEVAASSMRGLEGSEDIQGDSEWLSACCSLPLELSRIDPDDDDYNFCCPFAIDDDLEVSDSQIRAEGPDYYPRTIPPSRRSKDAAIGTLIHMMKTAPPLRRSPSFPSQLSIVSGNASNLLLPRKAADALEELQSFQGMKEMLIFMKGAQLASKT